MFKAEKCQGFARFSVLKVTFSAFIEKWPKRKNNKFMREFLFMRKKKFVKKKTQEKLLWEKKLREKKFTKKIMKEKIHKTNN